ncbi:hypothetical protein AMS59_13705 [Lysinibacillus sp. FJAT-14745]|uniref:hypothetical protein n=1 Tax=Lysinibacillus sp. FJAT-14745 TaxID=1704289 RepID=UPI0006C67677|nr:hypothetical protein [Lysinibacillus sp. FJAT-14745]KOP78148.1 hypothetical protein AMS59_13705 [Lysinibacillus sp. FJAT-14745]
MSNCPVCNSKANVHSTDALSRVDVVECELCGRYVITEFVHDELGDNNKKRCKLKAILRERSLKGYEPIAIYKDKPKEATDYRNTPIVVLDELLKTFPKNIFEKFDRTLLNFSNLIAHPGDTVYIEEKDSSLFFVETEDEYELVGMITYMVENGMIYGSKGYPDNFKITIKGWERLNELNSSEVDSKQVFVAMWFNEEVETAYTNAIEQAIKDNGYEPIRIDKVQHNNKIDDEIIANIKKSNFVVADFTGHRGGVYFEAGYAMGLGLPVIWCCRKDHLDDLHFDTRQYSHLVWETEEELYSLLDNRVKATIK